MMISRKVFAVRNQRGGRDIKRGVRVKQKRYPVFSKRKEKAFKNSQSKIEKQKAEGKPLAFLIVEDRMI